MNEQEIIDKIRNGDMAAFETLYSTYQKKALRLAYLITGNQNIAMDVVQEAFVECYLSIENLRETTYFTTWFYRIVTRTAWRCLKKEKRFIPVEGIEELLDANESYGDPYKQSDLSEFMISQINKMSYKKRTTLILYYYNELSIKEIAKVMGCFEGTVKSRLNGGRRELKKYLEDTYAIESKEGGRVHEVVTDCR